MAIIKRKRSSSIVTRNASPRTASLVFDISHSMSSVSTVARATVEANVIADKRLMIGRAWLAFVEENGRAYALVFKDWASPDRKGKSFWSTNVETSRKVTTKGREEKTIAVKAGIFPGLHSSQSGSMNGLQWGQGVRCISASSGSKLVESTTYIVFQRRRRSSSYCLQSAPVQRYTSGALE